MLPLDTRQKQSLFYLWQALLPSEWVEYKFRELLEDGEWKVEAIKRAYLTHVKATGKGKRGAWRKCFKIPDKYQEELAHAYNWTRQLKQFASCFDSFVRKDEALQEEGRKLLEAKPELPDPFSRDGGIARYRESNRRANEQVLEQEAAQRHAVPLLPLRRQARRPPENARVAPEAFQNRSTHSEEDGDGDASRDEGHSSQGEPSQAAAQVRAPPPDSSREGRRTGIEDEEESPNSEEEDRPRANGRSVREESEEEQQEGGDQEEGQEEQEEQPKQKPKKRAQKRRQRGEQQQKQKKRRVN